MIYTKAAKEAVSKIPKPFGALVHFVEYRIPGQKEGFLLLRIYSEQFDSLTETQRGDVVDYTNRVKRVLSLFGINATLDAVIGWPPEVK